jgi:hypothetical protein
MNLKKTAFREQMFDDPMIDREVHIRKGVLRIFNKREEEFRKMLKNTNLLKKMIFRLYCYHNICIMKIKSIESRNFILLVNYRQLKLPVCISS